MKNTLLATMALIIVPAYASSSNTQELNQKLTNGAAVKVVAIQPQESQEASAVVVLASAKTTITSVQDQQHQDDVVVGFDDEIKRIQDLLDRAEDCDKGMI